MNTAKKKINHTLEKGAETSTYLKSYLTHQYDLKRLEASKIAAKAASTVVETIVIAVLSLFIFLLLTIAAVAWLAELIGSYPLAFLAIAGVILFILIIFLLAKKALIRKPAANKISNAIFKEGIPSDSEEEIQGKIKTLEALIHNSTNDLVASTKDIEVSDFVPDGIQKITNSGVVKGVQNLMSSNKKKPTYDRSKKSNVIKNAVIGLLLNRLRKR